MAQTGIVVRPLKRIDRSVPAERDLEQKAAISARLGGYKSVRAFRIAALQALIAAYPPSFPQRAAAESPAEYKA